MWPAVSQQKNTQCTTTYSADSSQLHVWKTFFLQTYFLVYSVKWEMSWILLFPYTPLRSILLPLGGYLYKFSAKLSTPHPTDTRKDNLKWQWGLLQMSHAGAHWTPYPGQSTISFPSGWVQPGGWSALKVPTPQFHKCSADIGVHIWAPAERDQETQVLKLGKTQFFQSS